MSTDRARRPTQPTWTRTRLFRVLQLRFGSNSSGGVDTAAAATALGVSPRTVRRWLAGRSGRQLAHIPARRLEQLITLLQPAAERLRDEEQSVSYAREAITQLRLPRNIGVLPSWRSRRWDEQHLVAVLGLRKAGIRQLTVTRTGTRASDDLRRRGDVLDFVVVPTRFHATVLIHEVLHQVGPWRFQANPRSVRQGPTYAWLDDAPAVNLAAVYTTLQLPA